MAAIDDALDGLPARELERLRTKIDRRLQACAACGSDGALPVKGRIKMTGSSESRLTLLLCPACIERHRLPEGRAEEA